MIKEMNSLQREHKNKIDFKSANYYINFQKCYPEIKITQAQHTKIIFTFFTIVVRKIVLEMYRFSFTSLGSFYLIKNKPKIKFNEEGKSISKVAINWPETKKVRQLTGDKTKKVLYLNNHTNGYIYKLKWNRAQARFVNRTFYSFIPSTEVCKFMNKSIISNIKPLNAYTS